MNALETERLILRLPKRADFDAFAALWGNAEVLKNLPFEPQTHAQSWPRFLRLAGSWTISGYGNWLLFDKAGAFVGIAGFHDGLRGYGQDFDDHPELSYVLNPKYSGQGYATEACLAALDWMDSQEFGKLTTCSMGSDHAASIRVAEKCGYALLRIEEDEFGPIRLMTRNTAREAI